MDSTRFRECLALPGWTFRGLARHLGTNEKAFRAVGMGKRPVDDDLAAWLGLVAAAWATLPEELRGVAQAMEVDRGKYARRPVGPGTRRINDTEAAQLKHLAAFHRAFPAPLDWRGPRGHAAEDASEAGEDASLDG